MLISPSATALDSMLSHKDSCGTPDTNSLQSNENMPCAVASGAVLLKTMDTDVTDLRQLPHAHLAEGLQPCNAAAFRQLLLTKFDQRMCKCTAFRGGRSKMITCWNQLSSMS